ANADIFNRDADQLANHLSLADPGRTLHDERRAPACDLKNLCQYSLSLVLGLPTGGATSQMFLWYFARVELTSCRQLLLSTYFIEHASHVTKQISSLLCGSHSNSDAAFAAGIGRAITHQNSSFSHSLHK